MFVFNFKESKMPDKSTLQRNIDSELLTIQNQLADAVIKEENIYKSFINLSVYKYLNFDNASILNDYNEAFTYTNNMLEKLKAQENRIKTLKRFVSDSDFEAEDFDKNEFLSKLQDLLDDYYKFKFDTQNILNKEDKKLNKLAVKVLPFSQQSGSGSGRFNEPAKKEVQASKAESKPEPKKKPSKKEIQLEQIANLEKELTKAMHEQENAKYPDSKKVKNNLELVISEEKKKVFLPYYAEDVKEDIQDSDCTSYGEFIQDNYVVPLKYYKNQPVARFKEGFRLMREKEYESFKNSFSFGFRMMHYHALHPAVITACNSYEELDYFLECLEKNDLDSFNLFKVKFEVPPAKK